MFLASVRVWLPKRAGARLVHMALSRSSRPLSWFTRSAISALMACSYLSPLPCARISSRKPSRSSISPTMASNNSSNCSRSVFLLGCSLTFDRSESFCGRTTSGGRPLNSLRRCSLRFSASPSSGFAGFGAREVPLKSGSARISRRMVASGFRDRPARRWASNLSRSSSSSVGVLVPVNPPGTFTCHRLSVVDRRNASSRLMASSTSIGSRRSSAVFRLSTSPL
mmetsp:Transcript_4113/g.15264  ORF Transcript_4113/g.15264 Transcript_4113/m.15264 type:complete len:224 (-) Transcript_4113:168-839(-)